MISIAIDRFTARYRIPLRAMREQTRLQRIVADALERVLEGAAERAGLARTDYLCIRDLRASVTLRLGEPDSRLASAVAKAIADAISGVVDPQSPAVVRYSSRAHALIELATNAPAGDFERSWAWTQLGIWRADAPVRVVVAVDRVMRTLASESRHASAVVTALARMRPDAFAVLVAQAAPHAWSELARAAVGAAGAARALLDPDERESRTADSSCDPIASRIAARSAVWRAAAGRPDRAAEITQALAAFVLLEVEPALLRDGMGKARIMLAAIERTLDGSIDRSVAHQAARPSDPMHERAALISPVPQEAAPGARDSHGVRSIASTIEDGRSAAERRPFDGQTRARAAQEDGSDARAAAEEPREPRTRSDAHAAHESASRDVDGAQAAERAVQPGRARPDRAVGNARDDDRAAHMAAAEPRSDAPLEALPADAVADKVSITGDIRLRAVTDYAGLLYLLNLAEEAGLPDAIVRDPRLVEREPRWVLHQIAVHLTGAGPSDPAALAFAGLLPDARPPSSLEAPPNDGELDAIRDRCAVIAQALDARIVRRSDPDAPLVDFVCRRHAEILADPGWIDVHFSLEDVSIDIRRSGLDRDPGWIGWLGIAVRFLYA